MSRIGKQPILVPDKVDVKVEKDNFVSVKGPNGKVTLKLDPRLKLERNESTILVKVGSESTSDKTIWGLSRTLLNNMIVGVTSGFKKNLSFMGVGYKAQVSGKKLVLNLGFSHPIEYDIPEGISIKTGPNLIEVTGCDKELVGFTAAKIRSFRPPEPYKGKGIKYIEETIIRKAGKTGAKK